MKTNSIMKANKWLLVFFLSITTLSNLNAQVQDSGTINTGNIASAIGFETQATGDYSLAAGYQSISSGIYSTALGYKSHAKSNNSVAIGQNCISYNQSFSLGQSAKALGQQSLAIGRFVETDSVSGFGSIVLGSSISGKELNNNIGNSLMIGFNSTKSTLFVGPALNNNGVGKVGIGTTNPVARFQVADGDIFIQDIDKGIIMKSPDGNCWRGTVNNSGQLEFVKLTDCENLTTKSNEGTEVKSIKVFPNPSKEYFEVNCSTADCQKYNTISIFGTNGNLVFSQPFNSETTRISTSNIKSGSYVLKLHGRQESFTDIIVITH